MNKKILILAVLALCLPLARAADGDTDLDALKKELQELRQRTRQLEEKLERCERARSPVAAPVPATPAASVAQPHAAPEATGIRPKPWSPADPIRLAGDQQSFLNLSFDGLFAAGTSTAEEVSELQLGGHDPNQRGFTVQNLEAVLNGTVDPYFRAQGNLIFLIDREGESLLEVEEAYLETLSLPANLQIKGGQFFSEFGRHNQVHPHAWDFVDVPLVNARLLGPDGLRNPGGRISWLMPTPFYSELFLAIQNGSGETAFSFRNTHEEEAYFGRLSSESRLKSFSDLLFVPRYAVSFDLTDTQTLLAGVSGAFGPNASGNDTATRILGADLYWKWKSATHSKGFPFVSFQTEAMLREYDAGAFSEDLDGSGALDPGEPDLNGDGVADFLPRETLNDYGFYSQLLYGFKPGWVAGLRGDFVDRSSAGFYEQILGEDPVRAQRWRISPNLTWYPSEFSKIRLQYNYDRRARLGSDHSIWLQFEFLLGTHGAHKF
ncbi:MAG: hypothetical protein AB1813_06080 [Verrucomicrobiota bacterium]